MKINDLRSHVLLIWILGAIACYIILAIAAAVHYAGLTFADIVAPARNLFTAVGPTLIALIGTYFSGDMKRVNVQAGQRRVLLLLSYMYVAVLIVITVAMLFLDGVGLDQDAIEQQPAVNHYLMLTYVQ